MSIAANPTEAGPSPHMYDSADLLRVLSVGIADKIPHQHQYTDENAGELQIAQPENGYEIGEICMNSPYSDCGLGRRAMPSVSPVWRLGDQAKALAKACLALRRQPPTFPKLLRRRYFARAADVSDWGSNT